MAQGALPDRVPVRTAKLGRPLGDGRSAHGVVLLLPGGAARSTRRPSRLAAAAALPLARALVRAGRDEQLVAHVVRYRFHGWNGDAAHPAHDTAWALDEVVRRYGDVPVCLVGTDVGARAALRAGGHPAVTAVLALAPWLPPGEEEPVTHLTRRQVMLVQGTADRRSDPELSFRFAVRAKKARAEVCRFEVHADGHALRQYRREVTALAKDFVLGVLCGREFSRPVTDALAAPPPLGLRMPLASGFGDSPGF